MYEDLKLDICLGARIFYRHKLHKGIAGHMSIKVSEDRILANRFGPSFLFLKPKDILTLDLNGNLVEGDGVVNETIRLHCIIHRHNSNIKALAHTHSPGVLALSALRLVPEPFDQHSCYLYEDVAVIEETYEGFTSNEERIGPIAQALAEKKAAILPNHGSITKGATIQEAVAHMMLLEDMVNYQLAAAAAGQSLGVKPQPIAAEAAKRTKAEMTDMAIRFSGLQLFWNDWVSQLRQTDPELFQQER